MGSIRTMTATYDDPSDIVAAVAEQLKIVVDYDECEANAVCVGIAPEVFEVDDEDNLWVHVEQPGPELIERVKEAVAACPKRALYLRPVEPDDSAASPA